MKSLLIVSSLALMLLTNSCQDFNSNTFDEFRFSGFDLTSIEGRAMRVINDRCVNCHSGQHNAWSSEKFRVDLAGGSDAIWISNGLIDTSGDFLTSTIIVRLINYGGNMPPGGPDLTAQEIFDLCAWIEGSDAGCPTP